MAVLFVHEFFIPPEINSKKCTYTLRERGRERRENRRGGGGGGVCGRVGEREVDGYYDYGCSGFGSHGYKKEREGEERGRRAMKKPLSATRQNLMKKGPLLVGLDLCSRQKLSGSNAKMKSLLSCPPLRLLRETHCLKYVPVSAH